MNAVFTLLVAIVVVLAVSTVEAQGPPAPIQAEVFVRGQLPHDTVERQTLLREKPCALGFVGESTVVLGMDLVVGARFTSTTGRQVFAAVGLVHGPGPDGSVLGARSESPDLVILESTGSGAAREIFFNTVRTLPDGLTSFVGKVLVVAIGNSDTRLGSKTADQPLIILSSCP